METATVGSGTVVTTQQPTSRGFNDLSSEDFFALLITQLQSQDPLNPMDNQQFLDQISSVRQMEQSATLNQTLKALAAEQRFGATTGLIGHYVSGTVTDNAGDSFEVQGLVIGVRYESGGRAILELHDGRSLPADAVEQVTLLENLPPEIMAQLQSELDMMAGGSDAVDREDGGQSARAARKDPTAAKTLLTNRGPARQPTVSDLVRGLGRRADTTASVLDALFSPGLSVGI